MSDTPSGERSGPGLRVATVAGVPVYVGASWLLLAVVVTVITAGDLRELGATAYLVGAGRALTLLVAVLVHEAAHAVTARRLGLVVHRVVADLWGGHTAYDPRGVTPARSALIAVCGPLANLALAALAAGAGLFVASDGVVGLLLWGAVWFNLLLAVFNLLPGLPLDGGQIVDAAVWAATGRRDRGLVAAGWSGRVLALLVVAAVLVPPLVSGTPVVLFSVFWAVLVAGFLWVGASSAIQGGRARRALGRVRVGDVAAPVAALAPDTPLGTALRQGHLVVCPDAAGRPTLVLLPLPDGRELAALDPSLPVSAVATRVPDGCLVEADAGADVTDVVLAMQTTRWGLAVLTSGGRPWGVVGADALNGALADS
ncbi:MAG TPA: site-2 protease family protein [Dermatophilaceae bacterium]|nr:site-2 protease family protein [Dermatophilaceae bacterium]